MILGLAGCFGLFPFRNEPPELLSVNGIEVEDEQVTLGPVDPGGEVPLALEVDDPEGDGVRIWFPLSLGEVDFDPDGRAGVWTVPLQAEGALGLSLVLEDDRDPPARSDWTLWFEAPSDSGLD